jgi:hypothetical protein
MSDENLPIAERSQIATLMIERDALRAELALRTDECDTIAGINHGQWLALENVRLLAARHRKEEWAQSMLRFCDQAGNSASPLRAAPAPTAQPQADPDMRHPKIQALIGAKARREIELMLVEQLLDEGPDTETTSTDMEYWGPMHDRLREKLIQASSAPTAQPTTDALPNTLPLLEWATERWYDEVSNRPLVNKNRRTLDDTWRQVIRYAGGNPDELLGQSHDAEIESMRANTGAHGIGEQLPTAQPVQAAPVSAEDALVKAARAALNAWEYDSHECEWHMRALRAALAAKGAQP